MIRHQMRTAGTLAAVGALLVTAACGGSSKSSTKSDGGSTANLTKGGTLKIVSESDVGNLDTSQAYEVVQWTLARAVTRQLVSYAGSTKDLASDTETQPDLATYKISDDKKTYTFTLKDNIFFAGPTSRAIVSKDFTYALKRLCDPNGASGAIGYYTSTIAGFTDYCDGFAKVKTGDPAAVKAYIDGNDISGIKTPDDKTITFTLNQPAGDFLNILALPFATPEAEEVISPYLTDSPDMRQHFVSSGPYYIASYTPDKSYVFKRNTKWDASTDELRKAYVDEIDVDLATGSDDAEFQQITAGTADVSLDVTFPPQATVVNLKSTKSPTLRIVPEGRRDYVVFNMKPADSKNADPSECGKALQKVEVRQAINYAVNKKHIVQARGGSDAGMPAGQVLTTTITGYKLADPYGANDGAGDPAKAKQMLADAGYPNGLTCNFLFRPKNRGQDIATTLQQDLAASGIKLNLVQVPDKEYYAKHLQLPEVNDWDMSAPGWSPDWQGNAARSFFLPLLSKKYAPCVDGTTNYGCYGTDAVDAKVDAALASSDPASLWADVDKTVMADAPWAPLDEVNAISIVSTRVKGFRWFNFADNGDIANMSVM